MSVYEWVWMIGMGTSMALMVASLGVTLWTGTGRCPSSSHPIAERLFVASVVVCFLGAGLCILMQAYALIKRGHCL